MALSGSFDYTLNRDQLIKNSLVDAQIINDTQTPSATMIVYCADSLNRMIKAWQMDGLYLWVHNEVTLFLVTDQIKYLLGPSGDHATESYVETAIRIAAVSGATTLEVDSTTGITAADYIGVEQDDGTMKWTTVSSVTDSDTLVLSAALAAAAAVDNVVFAYTTKIQRPLRITSAHYRTHAGNDRDLNIVARKDYWDISEKTSEGTPNSVLFIPTLTNSELRIWQEPTEVTDIIKLICQVPFDDMDAASNNFRFPVEALDAIHWNLSYRLAVGYRSPPDVRQSLKEMARDSKRQLLDFDAEIGPTYIQPDAQWLS